MIVTETDTMLIEGEDGRLVRQLWASCGWVPRYCRMLSEGGGRFAPPVLSKPDFHIGKSEDEKIKKEVTPGLEKFRK